MSCTRIRRLIGVYRELDRAERRMLASHLRECESCRLTWQAEQRVLNRLRAIPELEPPPGLQRELLAIPALLAGRPRGWSLPKLLPILLLGLLGGLWTLAGVKTALFTDAPDSAALGEVASPDIEPIPGPGLGAVEVSSAIERRHPMRLRTPEPARLAARLEAELDDSLTPAGNAALPGSRWAPPPFTGNDLSGQVDPNGSGQAPSEPSDDDRGPRDRKRNRPEPTLMPAPTALALSCVDLTLRIFTECPACSGELPPGQALPLPVGIQYAVFNENTTFAEGRIATAGASALELSLDNLCEALPLTVEIYPPEDLDWRSCPQTGALSQEVREPGALLLEFGLTQTCALATEVPASPTPGPSVTAEPPPSGSPTLEPSPTTRPVQQTPPASSPTPPIIVRETPANPVSTSEPPTWPSLAPPEPTPSTPGLDRVAPGGA